MGGGRGRDKRKSANQRIQWQERKKGEENYMHNPKKERVADTLYSPCKPRRPCSNTFATLSLYSPIIRAINRPHKSGETPADWQQFPRLANPIRACSLEIAASQPRRFEPDAWTTDYALVERTSFVVSCKTPWSREGEEKHERERAT